ncbi:hypothetical protein [Pseudoclavibacter helvolus]|uniref:hypothetical protein n=1 Tax=Pseudoclavibacter helvolus TaxID=255205 RepID=UPI003C77557E
MLKTTAWSVPVIAVATAAPLASASGDVVVENPNPFLAAACTEARGLFLTATNNGNPAAGVQIEVTLPAGWSWSSGVPGPRVFTTGASGVVEITGAIAGSGNGSTSISVKALPAGPTTSIPVEVTGTNARQYAFSANEAPVYQEMPGVPDGSTAVAWNTYLAPGGVLYSYHPATGYRIAQTGVTSVKSQHYSGGSGAGRLEQDITTFVAGTVANHFTSDLPNPALGSPSSVPAGTRAVGWETFLYPSGELWTSRNIRVNDPLTGVPTSTVSSAVVRHLQDSGTTPPDVVADYIAYVDATGAHVVRRTGAGAVSGASYPSVPLGSTAVGWNTFLSASGDLYYQNTVVATGVVSATAQHTVTDSGQASDKITWVTAAGVGASAVYGFGAGSVTYATNFGPNAKVVGYEGILTQSEELWHGDTLVDTGVLSADAYQELDFYGVPKNVFAWTRRQQC